MRRRYGSIAILLASCNLLVAAPPASAPADADPLEQLRAERRRFQEQELITARPFTFVFNPGDAPRIVWRDLEEVQRLGGAPFTVRWFDADLNEAEKPDHPGRWAAYIEGRAPNGTPLRRALTFFARPPGFLFYWPEAISATIRYQPGPIAEDVWPERQAEIDKVATDLVFRGMNDSEAAAVLLAGLSEAKALGRAPESIDSALVRRDEHLLRVKLRVLGLEDKVRELRPPRRRAQPAPMLREGSPTEAGVHADAKQRIDEVCRAWAADSGEPFVILVARRGVIVTHEAFGTDKQGRPIGRDYRADVASITKNLTAIMFSLFVDQGLIDLDDSIGRIFPDYPDDPTRVPTFRQCLTHMSGLSGHGDFGGVRHPFLDNVVLNGIDANRVGKAYIYTGMGFDLAAEAMELVTGKSALRLYREHLFEPLGMGDLPMDNASAGAQFTALQLATLGQWLANHGSYGELEFISEKTFERLLPEDLSVRYPGVTNEVEGMGMHWMRDPRPGKSKDSTDPADFFFGLRTLGHGSLSSCIYRVDLDSGLVVVQIRRTAGPRFGEWQPRFFEAIAASIVE